jgi:hypothetical protein
MSEWIQTEYKQISWMKKINTMQDVKEELNKNIEILKKKDKIKIWNENPSNLKSKTKINKQPLNLSWKPWQ